MSSAASRTDSLSSGVSTHGAGRPPAWALADFRDDDHDEDDRQPPPATAPIAVTNQPPSRSPTLPPPSMSSPQDYRFLKELGSGSWSTVMEAAHASTNKRYAVKILSKSQLIKQKKVKYANVEKDALAKLSGSHPGIVKMYAAFQDEMSLYFVLDLAPHGDLADLVKKYGSLSLRCSRWYTAQIIDAVLWMHSKGILHRDMKPENVLLDNEFRVRLTDFGSAYIAPQGDLSPRSSTFVGSAAYVSPELLDRTLKSTSNSSDIWAIGCTLFFMVAGTPAFAAINDYQSFRKIEALDYTYPQGFYDVARDLTQQMLVLDPLDRLGVEPKSSPAQLRNHTFFSNDNHPESTENKPIRWDTLWKDPPVPPETGIVKPAPPVAVDENNDGDIWDSVVNEFSLMSVSSQTGGPLSPIDLLPPGPPVDVPPDVVPCEVTETVYVNGSSSKGDVQQDEGDDLDNPLLKAKDWSNVLSTGETIRRVVSARTPLRRGLLKQPRSCALLLTSLPRVLCVTLEGRDHAPGQSDVKYVFHFQRPDNAPAKRSDKPEVVGSCRTEELHHRLILRVGEKEYWYELMDHKALVWWRREIESLVQP